MIVSLFTVTPPTLLSDASSLVKVMNKQISHEIYQLSCDSLANTLISLTWKRSVSVLVTFFNEVHFIYSVHLALIRGMKVNILNLHEREVYI